MAQGYDFSRLRVLVVDDNRFMRETLRAILGAFGIEHVASTSDTSRAWALLSEFKPDIVLLDWRLEGDEDGIAFVKRVRTDPETPDPFVPVVMLTGNAEAKHVVEARESGIDLYLAKPISAETLYNRLVAAVEQAKPFVRTLSYFGPDRRGRGRADYEGPRRRGSDHDMTDAA